MNQLKNCHNPAKNIVKTNENENEIDSYRKSSDESAG